MAQVTARHSARLWAALRREVGLVPCVQGSKIAGKYFANFSGILTHIFPHILTKIMSRNVPTFILSEIAARCSR